VSVPPTADAPAVGARPGTISVRRASTRADDVLRWISVLSLDAPLVALAWLWALGRPTAWEAGALALAVWWGYAVDRWLDGWKREVVEHGAARHRFAARHRWAWGAFLAAVFAAAFAAIPARLEPRLVSAGFVLAALLALYTALDQLWPRTLRVWAQRESWVALAVAAAVVLFAGWGSAGSADLTSATGVGLALFALCAADCRAIRLLEGVRTIDRGLAGVRGPLGLCGVSAAAFGLSGGLPQALAALGFGVYLALCFERRGPAPRGERETHDTVAPSCDLALAALGLGAALFGLALDSTALLAS
jgi:hypothetical protein